MEMIYKNARVAIAATLSLNTTDGILVDRNNDDLVAIPYDYNNIGSSEQEFISYRHRLLNSRIALSSQPGTSVNGSCKNDSFREQSFALLPLR
jgi:hypothetical protein